MKNLIVILSICLSYLFISCDEIPIDSKVSKLEKTETSSLVVICDHTKYAQAYAYHYVGEVNIPQNAYQLLVEMTGQVSSLPWPTWVIWESCATYHNNSNGPYTLINSEYWNNQGNPMTNQSDYVSVSNGRKFKAEWFWGYQEQSIPSGWIRVKVTAYLN